MTIEEAIKALILMEHVESIAVAYEPGERREDTTVRELKDACRMGSEAIRTQQAHTKMDRSRWEGCELCKGVTGWTQDLDDEHHEVEFLFCPKCGRPITEESWVELEWRIGGK